MRVKSLKKELTKEEERTKENQARKEKEKEEKRANPIQLSNYKYEPQVRYQLLSLLYTLGFLNRDLSSKRF